jgi:hypothetical protein
VEGVCAVVAGGVRGCDSKRSRACALLDGWMAEAWLVGELCERVRACAHSSLSKAWGAKAGQSPKRSAGNER